MFCLFRWQVESHRKLKAYCRLLHVKMEALAPDSKVSPQL